MKQKEKQDKKLWKKMKRNWKWILVSIFLFLFVWIVKNILENDIDKFDNVVYQYVSKGINEHLTKVVKIVTHLGGAKVLILLSIFSFFIVKKKRYGVYISLNLMVASFLNQVLKHIFVRPRPEEMQLIQESGYSFPSRTFYGEYGILWIDYLFYLYKCKTYKAKMGIVYYIIFYNWCNWNE